MKRIAILFTCVFQIFVFKSEVFAQSKVAIKSEKQHFMVKIPENWLNDTSYSKQFGLPCFLYPKVEEQSDFMEYIYVLSIDKMSLKDSLSSFMSNDIKKFSTENPDMNMHNDSIGRIEGTVATFQYTFSNLYDKHFERVVYAETQTSFIVFSFACTTQENLKKYESDFKDFIYSTEFQQNSLE